MSESGQALVETALFSVMVILLGLGMATLIPIHRARTAATAAALSCAQFIAQSPNPAWAAYQAEQVAWRTLDARWSGAAGAEYQVQVLPPAGPGAAGGCAVLFKPYLPFGTLLGLGQPQWGMRSFVSLSESWKARWR